MGSGLVIGSFSLSALFEHLMYRSIPGLPPTMRPMQGIDYVMFTINPILPIIVFSGIIILLIGIVIFLIRKKKNR